MGFVTINPRYRDLLERHGLELRGGEIVARPHLGRERLLPVRSG